MQTAEVANKEKSQARRAISKQAFIEVVQIVSGRYTPKNLARAGLNVELFKKYSISREIEKDRIRKKILEALTEGKNNRRKLLGKSLQREIAFDLIVLSFLHQTGVSQSSLVALFRKKNYFKASEEDFIEAINFLFEI